MAFLVDTSKSTRFEIPHSPGDWIEVRPATSHELSEAAHSDNDEVDATWALLEKVITAWSADEPLTPENIHKLDMQTFQWLNEQLFELLGLRSDAEKKVSNGNSPDGQPPKRAATRRRNSGI